MPPDHTIKQLWSQKFQARRYVYVQAASRNSSLVEPPYTKCVFPVNRILFSLFRQLSILRFKSQSLHQKRRI